MIGRSGWLHRVTNIFVARACLSRLFCHSELLFGSLQPPIFHDCSNPTSRFSNFHPSVNVKMSLSNEKAEDERRTCEGSAQESNSSNLQLIDLWDNQGAATASPQVSTDLPIWDYYNSNVVTENEYEYSNDVIDDHQAEGNGLQDSAVADMDSWLGDVGAGVADDLHLYNLDSRSATLGSTDTFATATSSDDLSNGANVTPCFAAQEMNYEPSLFNNSAAFDVPFQSRLQTTAVGPYTEDPNLQPFRTIQPYQTAPQLYQPAAEYLQTSFSPVDLSYPFVHLTSQRPAERQVVAETQAVPSPPQAQAEKPRLPKKNVVEKHTKKRTKGNGHIEGFDRKKGITTLVGTYPADISVRGDILCWVCRDERCIGDDGMRESWTTKNGYKYHLQHNCLQNPLSKRSLSLAMRGTIENERGFSSQIS
jgi:hypothetical protein